MKAFENLPEGSIQVDIEPFRALTRTVVHDMQTQIRYMQKPTIRIKIFLFMIGIATVAALTAGYYIRESLSLKKSRDYWYREYVQLTKESK